jgi:hypothetical protein
MLPQRLTGSWAALAGSDPVIAASDDRHCRCVFMFP